MMRFAAWLLLLMVGLASCGKSTETAVSEDGANGPISPEQAVEACEVDMEFDNESVQAGGTVGGMLRLRMPKGWHTYSDPPGDSGMPPSLSLRTATGGELDVGPLAFPPPETFEDEAGVTYGYEGSVELPFKLTVPEATNHGQLVLKGTLQWLICRDICLPVESTVDARLDIIPPSDRTETDTTGSVE